LYARRREIPVPEDDDEIRDLAAELDEEPTEGLDAWPDDDAEFGRRMAAACPANGGTEVSE
jgi:hypothetical protein